MTQTVRASELLFRVDAESPVDHDVDLVVVGVIAPLADEPLIGSVLKLDALLGGAIARMRVGGGSGVTPGEAQLVDGVPGVKARKILLVGLGAAASLRLEALEGAGGLAVRHALAIRAGTVGFAPGLRDAGVSTFAIGDVSQAVVRGARAEFASHNAASRTSLVMALEASPANASLARMGIER